MPGYSPESYLGTWGELAEELIGSKDFGRAMKPSKKIRELVETLTEGISDPYQKMNESKARKIVQKLLSDIKNNSNERLNNFSKLNKVSEQVEPFEKTPTQKIKRYLYI